METKTKTYTSVNFWRVVFTFVIAIYHFRTRIIGYKEHMYFCAWHLGVEFFFIVSGFLLVWHYDKKITNGGDTDILPWITN